MDIFVWAHLLQNFFIQKNLLAVRPRSSSMSVETLRSFHFLSDSIFVRSFCSTKRTASLPSSNRSGGSFRLAMWRTAAPGNRLFYSNKTYIYYVIILILHCRSRRSRNPGGLRGAVFVCLRSQLPEASPGVVILRPVPSFALLLRVRAALAGGLTGRPKVCPRQVCCPAALRINRVISSGCEISERWLAFTSMVWAPIRLAMKRSRSGLMVRSSVETA
jgi:hypothetical protein